MKQRVRGIATSSARPDALSAPAGAPSSAPERTFPEIFAARALAHPDKLAFIWLGDGDLRNTTYSEMYEAARGIAAAIAERAEPGSRAVLFYQPGADYLSAFLGCLLAGVIAVPCYPPRNRRGSERIAAILRDCSPALAMTSPGEAEAMRKLVDCEGWLETSLDSHASQVLQDSTLHHARHDDVAFLQYTSGSTGTPKGVMITHRNLVGDAELIQAAFSLDADSVGATWLPPYHDMGLIGGLLQVLYLGIHSVVMSPNAFLRNPLAWLDAIGRYRVTHSGAPNFAYDLCVERIGEAQRAGLDLSSWVAAYCGAEPVRPRTLDRFAEAFAASGFRREAFLTCYGLAEATLMVSSSRRGAGPLLGTHEDQPDKTLVAAGAPVTRELRIVDPERGIELAEGGIGEIWVAGENVAAGYWGKPEASAEAFGARLEGDASGTAYMRTGDLGFLHDGQLFVSGRIKDLIIIGGRNVYPQDVEEASFASHPGLRIDAAAAFTREGEGAEQLVVVQELDFRRQPEEAMFGAIAEAVFERIGVQPAVIVLLKAGGVPRTSSGKIRRRQCRDDLERGALPELARRERQRAAAGDTPPPARAPFATDRADQAAATPAASARIVEWLCARIEQRLGLPARSINPAQSFFSHGVDSILAVETAEALSSRLGRPIEPTLFWDYPSPLALALHLCGEPEAAAAPAHEARATPEPDEPIAIVGLGCRLPGADDPEAFWRLLDQGIDAVREVPPARLAAGSFRTIGGAGAPAFTRIAGFLDEVDRFDGELFGIAPVEAAHIDPQQRLVLEVAWEALEHAGIAAGSLAGSQAGVFVGVSSRDYDEVRHGSGEALSLYDTTGGAFSVVANRLSYLLDLRGPSLAIDTACSSSLVAVHAACRSLRDGESTLAIAGGVNLILSTRTSEAFAESGVLSPDGRCKAFDDGANGYVRGEGCGMVVLKRLSDARRDGDTVHAVILGSAVQQDGRSNGLTAPNGLAQAAVIRRALAQAGVAPAAIGHVEAHGTGTALGDPVELNALRQVLDAEPQVEHGLAHGETPPEPCVIGSVKTHVGHLEAAAGIASLIKAVLSMRHERVPAQLHFQRLNHHCSLDGSRLEIAAAARAWPRAKRRFAGVSSFGFGGTLAHLVLADAAEMADEARTHEPAPIPAPACEPAVAPLLVWSAKTPEALERMTDRLAARLRERDATPAELAFSLQTGRSALPHRRALVCAATDDAQQIAGWLTARDPARLVEQLAHARARPVPVFMFPGQGAQRIGMARGLYRELPGFRAPFDACADGFAAHLGLDLRELLFAPEPGDAGQDAAPAARLESTALAQPALFALDYALARCLIGLGIRPAAMIGHSLGEYVAACLAGVFSLEDALAIVALRGRLMQALPAGAMASVGLGEAELAESLGEGLSLAAVNGAARCVVAGESARVDTLLAALEARGVPCRRLRVSHAFHSAMMEPAREPLREALSRITLRAPTLPFVSNLTGDWIRDEEAVDPGYWARHLREPVRFADGLATLRERLGDATLLLEVGPGGTLQGFARQQQPDAALPALALMPAPGSATEARDCLGVLARLWAAGCEPDWPALHRGAPPRRVSLPAYPFDRRRHWLEPAAAVPHSAISVDPASAPESLTMSASLHSPFSGAAAHRVEAASQASTAVVAPRPGARRERIEAELRELVAGLLRTDPARIDTRAALLELGADSLVLVQAVRQLETRFGVAVTIRQLFEELTSIAELAAHLERHVAPDWGGAQVVQDAAGQAAAAVAVAASAAGSALAPSPGATIVSAAAASPANASALERLIEQQLDLMRAQLALMGGAAPASAPSALAAPAAAAPRQPASASAPAPAPAAPRLGHDPYAALAAPQRAYLQGFVADLARRTAASKAHASQYREVIADYRALAGFRFSAKDPILPMSLSELFYPVVAEHSEGAQLVDLDGNRYVDLAMGFGVSLFGHGAPFVREAISAQLARGMHLGPQSPLAGEIARMIRELTGMERVAFCNSGTEAVMLAVRLARTRNGRPKIAQFTGSYHGWADGMLVAADPERDPYAVAAAPGLQTGSGEQALVLEYGSEHALRMIREHAHELSAVLVEPVQSRRPELQPREFLQRLRALTSELGIALIFDEMITGFRLHPGGAQAWFEVRADLVAYGKAVGGGMPIGIVAGDAAHMNGIDGGTAPGAGASADTTFFAGTFSKHPLALAATHAVLRRLIERGPELQASLNRRTDALVARLNRLFTTHRLPMQMVNCGSLFRLHCLHNLDLFCYHLLANGLYVWEGRTMYLSDAHSEADVDAIYAGFEASARALVAAGFFPDATPLPPPPGGRRAVPAQAPAPAAARAETATAGTALAATAAHAAGGAIEAAGARVPDFSLSFFGTYDAAYQRGKYDLLFAAARFADQQGFAALWLPERHFHAFGGLSPNPSVLAAALARETRHIELRAGSVVLPLHHPVRVAEEWAVVDNLSGGRVGIAVASGWHPNDFVFAPEAFGRHRELTFERLDQVRQLWAGQALQLPDGSGQPFAASVYPLPGRKQLPVWVTVVGNPDTYRKAAELGAGILTNLMGQSLEELARNIALYRQALAEHGHDPRAARVTVLLHTFVGPDREAARREAREPFLAYLKSSVGLFRNMARALGMQIDGELKPEDEAYLLSAAYERYVSSSALIGDPESCARIVAGLVAIGVDEIGCFIDFGVDAHRVEAQLPYLQQLRECVAQAAVELAEAAEVAATAGAGEAAPAAALETTTAGHEAGSETDDRTWPVSTAQRWLWLDHQRDARNCAHNICAIVALPAGVAPRVLDQALTRIVARHEVLRTSFAQRDDEVVQRVGAARELRVETREARSAADVQAWLAELAAEPFDLEHGPLFRALRVALPDGGQQLLWCMHEIVADGASAVLLQEEVTALMTAAAAGAADPLPPLAMQYRHYAAAQREQLASADHAARDYWHRQLAAPLPVLDLPFDRPLTPATPAAGARIERVIGGERHARLQALARAHHCTLFMFLQAAVAAWLARMTGQRDVVIASPVGARVHPGTERLIGFFLNTVLMRHRVEPGARFDALLRAARMTVFDGLEHQDYPFEQLLEELRPARVRNAFPVTPVMLNVLNYQGAAEAEEQVWSGALDMKAELELYAAEQGGELRLACHYREGLWQASSVEYLVDELVSLLDQVLADSRRPIDDYALFAEPGRLAGRYLRFVEPLEATRAGGDSVPSLVSRIAAQVRRAPAHPALESAQGVLDYRGLWGRAGAASRAWREALGLRRGEVVALLGEDRAQHVVGLLAALRAGAIAAPFSVREPLARQRAMSEAAGPALWVADALSLDRLLELHGERPIRLALWGAPPERALPAAWQLVSLPVDAEDAAAARDTNEDAPAEAGAPAYLFFTSGSTGEPKPIVGRADSLAQFVDWEIDEFGLDATLRASQLASLSFDASLRDILVPLCAGGTLCLPPRPTRDLEPQALLAWLEAERISLVHTVPAVFRTWLPLLERAEQLPALGHVLMSGEPLLPNDVRRWQAVFGERVQLVNLYGATETTLVRCFHRVTAGDAERDFIPVGRPMAGTRAIVLDANRQICPPGMSGELWLRTAWGTLGYYRQPERTAQVFVRDLFDGAGLARGEVVYRSGDLAMWLEDGTLRVLGRLDSQLKVRGVRVEAEEIENALYAHGGIELAAVVARTARSGETSLAAYYTAPEALDAGALKAHLATRLPAELVPATIERRASLPLTASGKVDRRALGEAAADAASSAARAFEAPQGDLEAAVAALFAQVLEVPQVGRHDNFFECGGHSLRALRAISRIRKLFGVDLAPDRFFEAATPAALAHEIERLREAAEAPRQDGRMPPVRRRATDATLPLSYEQERVWAQEVLGLAGTGYNIPVALSLRGAVRAEALERALSALVERHEILRTRFEAAEGGARQIVEPAAPVALARLDLGSEADESWQAAALDRLLRDEVERPFDLASGPLLRAALVRLDDTRHVMLLNMHHIVSDGWSADVLVRELGALYAGFAAGRAVELAPLPVQYGDYAIWQREWLDEARLAQQLDYWRGALDGAPVALELPTDRPRPAEQSFRGARAQFVLPGELVARLTELAQRDTATLYMVLLAGFATLLGRYSGQRDIVIGAPVAGRRAQELEGLIGFFINTLALRADLSGNPGFAELLGRVKRNALAAYAHQDLPFEKLVAELAPARDLSRQPLFQVVFGFQQATPPMSLPGIEIAELDSEAMAVKFDLSLQMRQHRDHLACTLEYATDLFDRASIERMIGHYRNLLEAAVRDPRQRIGELDMLGAADRAQVVREWNRSEAAYPAAQLTGMVEAQARRTPEAVALRHGEATLSYARLDARANQIAHALIARGVGPDTRVAICVRRGLDMVTGLLGVLKAGAAYVPIDPAYPAERLAYMLEDCRPRVLLTQAAVRAGLPEHAFETLSLDADAAVFDAMPDSQPTRRTLAEHLAYVIYTSGSTGRPKGVMISHGGLSNYLQWALAAYEPAPERGAVVSSSLSFDATVTSLWTPLLCGGTVTLLDEGDEIAGLEAHVRNAAGLVKITPAHLDALGRRLRAEGIKAKTDAFVIGGEALSAGTVALWQEVGPGARLVNEYGPTETVVGCLVYDAQNLPVGMMNVPVGRPVANSQIYILDAGGEPVPVGVTGEIFIGGAGVARGYLNRPSLTAERFVPDPFGATGARMYRTGDLARYEADGNIIYLGRNDEQVKLRGFRIELGEIGAMLGAHPGVRDAVVVMREEADGDRRLVGYYTSDEGRDPGLEVLRAHLKASLPDYMVPSALLKLDALPLTPNGKLDRKALPQPGETSGSGNYVEPEGEIETRLARIWCEVLKVERVGRHDNFFELGGHSLLAIGLIERMRQAGLHADVRAIFGATTLAVLAAEVSTHSRAVVVPPNCIAPGCTAITPAMLPLVRLGVGEIAAIVAQVPGGAANVQDIYPLAPLQEGVLFHHLMARDGEHDGDPYVLSTAFGFDSRARLDGFVAALRQVVARHDILRTAVFWEDLPEPVQVVLREAPLLVEETGLDPAGGDAVAQLRARFDVRERRMDVRRAPLLRAFIARDTGGDFDAWVMLVQFHHLAMDHTALEVVQEEVRACLGGEFEQLPPAAPFRSYVAQARLGVSRDEHAAFFREMLGEVDEPSLPFGLGEIRGDGFGIDEARLPIDAALAARVREQARRLGASAASLFHLAWAQVLGRASGRHDVVFGTVLFGRLQATADAERTLGMFINTLPVRIGLDTGAEQGVTLTHRRLAQLLRHEHAPLVLAQQCSGVPAPAPLFSALLNYRYSAALPEDDAAAQVWAGIESLDSEERTNYPLVLSVDDFGEGFGLSVQVAGAPGAQIVGACVQAALAALVAALEHAPRQCLADLPVLPEAERGWLLDGGRDAARVPLDEATLHGLVEAQVARTPQAIALVAADGASLSYAQLNRRANRLAHRLIALGIGADARVAICAERGVEMVVGLLATLKAGAAYLPLDPAYPAERLADMLADSAAAALLMHEGTAAVMPALGAGDRLPVIDIGAPASEGNDEDKDEDRNPAPAALGARHPAYVIYTSGSTGRPKGVVVEHRQIVNHMRWMQAAFPLGEGDAVAQKTPFSFDASVWEFFAPLLAGGRLEMAAPDGHRDPVYLAGWLRAQSIHTVQMVPTLLAGLLEIDGFAGCPALRRVFCGGEALPAALVERFRAKVPGVTLVNLYGPTETTIDSSSHVCSEPSSPAASAGASVIGRPLPNTRLYLLDARLNPVPPGVAGELYVAGAGVTRGYLARPALSAAAFLPDPFAPEAGARMYRTGDLARRLPDGNLVYLGRNDGQLKLRGLRIEPGEIEARMRGFAGIGEAVVMVRDEVEGGLLAAYYTRRGGEAAAVSAEALREHLAAGLPAHMVPQALVALDALPLMPNGKLDRKALPAPSRGEGAGALALPMSAEEQTVAGIWAGVLGLERVGRDDDFFALGGHSLLATQMISRVRRAFGVEVPLRVAFDAPTLAAFAHRLAALDPAGEAPPLVAAERPELLPLSFEQQRLWFLDQLHPDSTLYHVPVALRVAGAFDVAAFQGALEAVVARHEVLRTAFAVERGVPTQRIAAARGLAVPLVDLAALPAGQAEPEAQRLVREAASLPFDLAAGLPLRCTIVRLGPLDHVIALTLHHIAFDGWSTGVLIREIRELYEARTQQRPPRLAPLPLQYADFALWQRGWLDGSLLEGKLDYWRRQLAGASARLALPTDRPRPAVQSLRGATQAFTVPRQTADALRRVGREAQTTLFTTLYAAFQVLLWRYSGEVDICVGTPVANRNHLETEALVGFFVNTLVLRTPLDPLEGFDALLRRARDTALAAYAHQDVPFERLVEELNPQRELSHSPLYQVMLVLQNAPADELSLGDLEIRPYALGGVTAKCDLTLNVDEDASGLACRFEYCADLFDATTIERMAAQFQQLLEEVVNAPSRAVGMLPLVDQTTRAALLREALGETVALAHPTIPALFAERVAAHPRAIAVEAGEQGEFALTYAELDARANRLAQGLRALGVGPDVPVALCAQRSAEMVVGLLGILKAGGAYLPLDPDYPPERLDYLVEDARPRALVGDAGLIAALAARLPSPPPSIALDAATLDAWPAEPPPLALHGDHLAYLVYTSGSTGQPKGVAITHRNVARLVHRNGYFDAAAAPRVLQFASLNFDAATFEIWAPLLNGGTLVMAAPQRHSLERLAATLVERRIDMLWLTASLFDQMVERHLPAFASVRHVLTGGEALSLPHVRRFLEAGFATRLTNGYGPTESTTFACCHAIEPASLGAQSVPIGRPIANTRAHVLDARGEPVPVGIAGELWLGGEGLARGYLNRPDLSAERFVPDPFAADGSRLYRTGDLVRRLPDGTLDYVGRIDSQVKIRGFRIETGEIEAVLLAMPWVAGAAVAVIEDEDGERRLAAYVVRRPEAREVDPGGLRGLLRQRLPEYMMPSAFVELDALPLTANGKIDLRALPAPSFAADRAEHVAPRTPLEELLAGIWARVLKLDRVGVHDNFFDLGGHSLSATQVVAELREHLPMELPLRAFFEAPTIEAFAQVVETLMVEHLQGMSEDDAQRLLAQEEEQPGSAVK
ncbi:hybrid non-ribosomal peptide synthetase/type I polyketide synthase [Burkholderia gladioli]|uniref:D-alanine--poly(Phosphoribitol) ligase, subunit 1 n=1 Tax=Burkholderia gladioli TaxID=28095 RepID=A0AAW3ERJ8_BURGA|nr:hybrid non-ribosomal peptide synthetase/type I polyketide synthase [Burkholderia gladioli]KGC09274.1 D-alanine--poly(phosphoribitol) ligase, subunit 1 [Burkholderia gladioli]